MSVVASVNTSDSCRSPSLVNRPTTVHSLVPSFTWSPTSTPANCLNAPIPTKTSCSPGRNCLPATTRHSGCTRNIAGHVPRRVTPASPPARLERLAPTILSGHTAAVPPAPRKTCGGWAIAAIQPKSMLLKLSVLAALWSTRARSRLPVFTNVRDNPLAIAKTAMSTATTPPMPMTTTAAAAKRCGKLRRFMVVVAMISLNI